MKAEALSYFHMPVLTVVGLMIFFIFFISMLAVVFHRKRMPYYQQLAILPIGDD